MSRYAIKFPFRVRIHGGEFDESARAIHREDGLKTIQAESGIVLESTIERKQMSTKTTFKRIALVTVAALSFGVMSVAPSSAAGNLKIWCDIADGLATGTNSSDSAATNAACNGVAGAFNFVTIKTSGAAEDVVLTVDGGTFKSVTGGTTPVVAADAKSAQLVSGSVATVQVFTPAVGTITVKYWVRNASGILAASAAETVTITVNAAAQSKVVSATNSESILVASDSASTVANGSVTADQTATVSAVYATAPRATIKLKILDALKVAANDSLTATITSATGAGSIGSEAVKASGTSTLSNPGTITATSAAGDTGGLHNFYVFSNGIAGVATITIKAGTTTISTETVTFVGAATAYTVAVGATTFTGSNFQVGANASALKVTAKDAAGNLVVDGTTIYAFDGTAATATVLASATTTSGVATFSLTGVAAGSSVITFGNASTAATSTVTATTTVAVTKSTAKTVVLTLDKDSYEPGEKMTLTITATDADGKGVADGTRAVVTGMVANFGLTNASALSDTTVLLGGKVTQTIYAPATSGTFKITATEGAATDSTTKATLTVSATVVNPALTAAQEATDAANEATDAGNNAKDAADQAIEAADAATIAAQDAAAAAELAGEVAVAAAEAAGAIAQDALDAANAATDAALSAAEAADAATAAATEAKESADAATAAVAALSAEVAKLMADLNLRITKLGNTLATILKKLTK